MPTNTQLNIIAALTLTIGFLLGAITVAIVTRDADQLERQQAQKVEAERRARSEAETWRAMEMIHEGLEPEKYKDVNKPKGR